MRSVTGLFVLAGSTIGGFVPDLWHAGMFSLSGVVFSALGAVAGVFAAQRINA